MLVSALVGLVVVFVLFMFAVTLLNFVESTKFCSICHVMKPEVVAQGNSPHQRTDCGTCHVGPGVTAAIKAKFENVRYLWVYPLGQYERPVPSPIKSLRPVEVVCEQCHWPQKFYDDRLVIKSHYATDEANSLTRTQLLLRTGGGQRAAALSRGVHWHIDNPVYYIATDEKRQDIAWVQAQFQGVTTEYVSVDSNLTPDYIAKAEKRKMDCVDCHNRATHVFPNPEDSLNAALAADAIPSDLPFLKREAMKVLDKGYGTEAEAAKSIAAVADFYRTTYPDLYSKREADIKATVAALQTMFDNSAFPFMNVTWQTHANNIGHKDFPGCFRCHDGKHLSKDNQTIRLECNICHSIPQVAGPGKQLPPLVLAAAKEPESHRSTSWLAEHRYQFDASCVACHTADNAGGKDNSSFCSNSSCHGSNWKYVGLDAPKIRELVAPPKGSGVGGPPPVPHPIAPRTDCLLCHAKSKVRPFPDNHTSFKIDQCTTCHKSLATEAAAPAAATPQPAATPVATSVPIAPSPTAAPAAPSPTVAPPAASPTTAQPRAGGAPSIPHALGGRNDCLVCHDAGKLKPFPSNHTGRTIDTCQTCHKPK